MKYLRGSIDKILMLEVDMMHLAKWWVDVSFAVHHNIKSHMGATCDDLLCRRSLQIRQI